MQERGVGRKEEEREDLAGTNLLLSSLPGPFLVAVAQAYGAPLQLLLLARHGPLSRLSTNK
eukprot:1925680-Rhodomonas_salina.1